MRAVVVACLALLLSAPIVQAQTAAYRLAWVQPGATPVDTAGYRYTLTIDAGAPITLTPVSCSVINSRTECSAPAPTIPPGPHTLTLTVSNPVGSASAPPLSLTPPPAPTEFRFTFTIASTVP